MVHPSDWLEYIWHNIMIWYSKAYIYLYTYPSKVLTFMLVLYGISGISFELWLRTRPSNSTMMRVVPFTLISMGTYWVLYHCVKMLRSKPMTPEQKKEYKRLGKIIEENEERRKRESEHSG